MPQAFVDTCYFVAILDEGDDLHAQALELQQQIEDYGLVTSHMVLTEVLNMFTRWSDEYLKNLAAEYVSELLDNGEIEIVEQTPGQFQSALLTYKQFTDKFWSHTDCASCLIMQEKAIQEVLTEDKNFKEMGFTRLLSK